MGVARADLRTRECRNDSHRNGLTHAKGIADCKHNIAHVHAVTVPKIDRRQPLAFGIDLDDRKIGAIVREKHPRLELAAVGKSDGDVLAALHHVIVGDDYAVWTDDDARAQRLLHALTHLGRGAKEALKQRIGKHRIDLCLYDGA